MQSVGIEQELDLLGPDEYRVCGRQDRRLKAVLGCGVGLTLVDRQAGVGGLLHLLGAGLSSEESCRHQLEIFLAALEQEGARRDRLEGRLAGGAELGESSLAVDQEPGPQLATRVLSHLRELQLPALETETGGPFSCTLELDLDTLECTHLLHHPEPDEGLVHPGEFLSPFDLEQAILHIKPIPQIALETLGVIGRHNYRMRDLAQIIQKDQVITARVLGWCNAAGVSLGQEVVSIDQALVRMGEKRLLQLILAATLSGYFAGQDTGYAQSRGGLFHHALACAHLCSELAELLAPTLAPLAFTAGLLHDLGKVVLDHEVCRQAPEFYRVLRDERSLLAAEQRVLGVTHPEAGGMLARRWALAEPLATCIRWHHEPRKAPSHGDLCALVALADRLTRALWHGQQSWVETDSELAELLERFGMPGGSLRTLLVALPLAAIHRNVSLA